MYGLVLEGGGTRGSYEVGVYKALMDENIEISGITGTSVGAINGAMFLQEDVDICEEFWRNVKPSMILDVEDEEFQKIYGLNFKKNEIKDIFERLGDIVKNGGIGVTSLKENLDRYINEDKIRNSNIDYGIVTYDISNKEPRELFIEDIPKGMLTDYILASASIPIFKRDKIDGNYYIDGAVYDNLPFGMLERRGYEKIILVRIYGFGRVRKIQDENYIIISPDEDLGSMLEFDKEKIEYNMQLGYYDTIKIFRKLLGQRYYIEEDISEDEAFQFFSKLEDYKIQELLKALNISNNLNLKKSLFQYIIPKIDNLMENESQSYRDLFIKLIEAKADYLGMERFKIYGLYEIYNEVIKTKVEVEENKGGILDKILQKVEEITILNKEGTILKIADIIFSF